ncbi:hypothetical protein BC830DRAFT_1174975 [Chytriomyces sp. MP71]|nr:hypothetical protein BC830DRAFT_1174975 [Chytriomyces sp. MP71]
MVRVNGSATPGGRSSIQFGDDTSSLAATEEADDTRIALATAASRLRHPRSATFDPDRPLTPTTPSRPGSRGSGNTPPGGASSIVFGSDPPSHSHSKDPRRASSLNVRYNNEEREWENPLSTIPVPVPASPRSSVHGFSSLAIHTRPSLSNPGSEELESLVRSLIVKSDNQTALLHRLFDIVNRIDAETAANAEEIAAIRMRLNQLDAPLLSFYPSSVWRSSRFEPLLDPVPPRNDWPNNAVVAETPHHPALSPTQNRALHSSVAVGGHSVDPINHVRDTDIGRPRATSPASSLQANMETRMREMQAKLDAQHDLLVSMFAFMKRMDGESKVRGDEIRGLSTKMDRLRF